jgi:hypothetical protein
VDVDHAVAELDGADEGRDRREGAAASGDSDPIGHRQVDRQLWP